MYAWYERQTALDEEGEAETRKKKQEKVHAFPLPTCRLLHLHPFARHSRCRAARRCPRGLTRAAREKEEKAAREREEKAAKDAKEKGWYEKEERERKEREKEAEALLVAAATLRVRTARWWQQV